MKNFYHYILAMLYLKIARYAKSENWLKWMDKSTRHAAVIAKSLKDLKP